MTYKKMVQNIIERSVNAQANRMFTENGINADFFFIDKVDTKASDETTIDYAVHATYHNNAVIHKLTIYGYVGYIGTVNITLIEDNTFIDNPWIYSILDDNPNDWELLK